MKKLSLILVLLFSVILIVQAVGPKFPCLLWWTPSPSVGVTGYWFYWRSSTETYSNDRRWPIPTNGAPFNLTIIGLPKGEYFCTMSATNEWSESDLAVEIPWYYNNPNKPTDIKINIP